MGWLAYNFECASVEARNGLLEWFEENHELERRRAESSMAPKEPTPDVGADGTDEAADSEGGTDREYEIREDDQASTAEIAADVTISLEDEAVEGEIVWLDRYCYLTLESDPGPLLQACAAHWDRAVHASIETTGGGCKLAILYTTIGSRAIEAARYHGRPNNAALDVMYVLAMEHQFRFRAYADLLPSICSVPFPSAFHTPQATDPDSDMFEDMAEATGVEPTPEGLRMLQRDPMIAEEEWPELDAREQFERRLRSRLLRPIKAAVVAAKAKL